MKMRAFLVASLIVESLVIPSAAQQPTAPTPPVDPSSISFEHDGVGVKGYALYIADAQGLAIRIDVGLLRRDKSGKVVAPLPPLPPGTYSVDVVAYNQAGESPRVRAQPSEFTLTRFSGSKPEATAKSKAPKTPDDDHHKAQEAAPKAKGGFLSRVYRGIVGSDDEGSGEK